MHQKLRPFLFLLFILALPAAFGQIAPAASNARAAAIDTLLAKEQWATALPLLHGELAQLRQAGAWEAYGLMAENTALALGKLRRTDSSLVFLTEALHTLQEAGLGESGHATKLLNYLAVNNFRAGFFAATVDAYDRAIAIFNKQHALGTQVAFAYKNAAQIFVRRQDYALANQYFEAAIRVDTGGALRAATYGQMANASHFAGDENAVRRYYSLGMQEPGKRPVDEANLNASAYTAFLQQGDFEQARRMIQSALKYYLSDPGGLDNQLRCHTALAEIAARQHQYGEAENQYRAAEKSGLTGYKGKSREMAKLYTEWGDFCLANGRSEAALPLYQKALIQAYPDFNDPDPSVNPNPKNVPLEYWAMVAPAQKARLLIRRGTLADRKNAADCFDLAFASADLLRRTYGNDDSKLSLDQKNSTYRREAALNLRALWDQTRDQAILNRMFAFFEDTRANTLREALQQQRAFALAGLPDSLLKREKAYREDMAILQVDLQNAIQDGNPTQTLQDRLLQLELQYRDLLQTLQRNYPQFQAFTHAAQTAALPAIQATLSESATLLSWFDAGDRYLCAVVGRNSLSAFEVPRDSALDNTLTRFQTLLADKNRQESDPDACYADAWFLKQRLLPDSILTGTQSLIIVPDGRLAYLSFEALLTAPYRGVFARAPWLLQKCPVQYAWSATLLTDAPVHPAAPDGMLQVAPFVASARDGLATLPNSLLEKPQHLPVDLLEGATATASAFLQMAPDHAVLHLSTHAQAGRQAEARIEFADRGLTLPEIYAQRLHATLVSLSACETGAGEFAAGEGVLSLARAFAYAGAQSLVASHWSVNERSTADLFSAFYQGLENGLSKSVALRQAKLSLLNAPDIDARKAPYYWAAFTLSGADGPLPRQAGWPWWRYLLLAGVASMGIWWAGRRFLPRRKTA